MLTLAFKKQLYRDLLKIQKAVDSVSIPLDAQSNLTTHVERIQMILIGWGAELSGLKEILKIEIEEDVSRMRMLRKSAEAGDGMPAVPNWGPVLDKDGEDWSDFLKGN